jgi:catechol 2,3-dioxygenase-like lactoylglutathione lyase family enzyme
MLLFGGTVGAVIGFALAGGLVALAGLPVYGPLASVVGALLSIGPAGAIPHVVVPIMLLFGAGLGLLVATIFFYLSAALGAALGLPLLEFWSRGGLIGASAATNFVVISAIPWFPAIIPLPWFPLVVPPLIFVVLLLALIPAVAANRFYQRVLGFLGWALPLNYLMLPLGVLLFLVVAPITFFTGGTVLFDFLTFSVETAGGALLPLVAKTSFNVGNFTFLPVASTGFTKLVSAHETGHTLNGAAFGGFFYWIGAIDENVPPLGRGPAAYSEMLAESHFSGPTGGPFIPMW